MARISHTMRCLPVSVVSFRDYRSVDPRAARQAHESNNDTTLLRRQKERLATSCRFLNGHVALCCGRDVFAHFEIAGSNVRFVSLCEHVVFIRGKHWRDEPGYCSVEETDRVRMFRVVYRSFVCSRGRDNSRPVLSHLPGLV